MKILYYDMETTGLSYRKHCAHQVAGIIEIDGEVVEEFNIKQAPHPKAAVDERALQISGVTIDYINAYQPFEDGQRQLVSILDKYVDKYDRNDKLYLAGMNNTRFDDFFLQTQFDLCGNKFMMSYFWESRFDLMHLAGVYLAHVRYTIGGFKLKNIAKALDVQFDDDKLHDALYDVRITRECIRKCAPQIFDPEHGGDLL